MTENMKFDDKAKNDQTALKERIEKYIEEHLDEMIRDLKDLCSIDSVRAEAKHGMPYGEGAHKALMAAKALCEKYGFKTKEYADRVISADMNSGEKCLDILAHMDVVAAGEGWTVTKPFEPMIMDGAIYGRGTSDDKGPAIAALYAMRAVKELRIEISQNCRLILGSDEECGSEDITYYYAEERPAPMTFTPDAEFPVINIEKGQFKGEIITYFNDTSVNENAAGHIDTAGHAGVKKILKLKCGDTINIVPGHGYTIVSGFEEKEINDAVNYVKTKILSDLIENIDYTIKINSIFDENDKADAVGSDHPSDKTIAGKTAADKPTADKTTADRTAADDHTDINTLDYTDSKSKEISEINAATVYRISVTGKGAHASTPETGVNAGVLLLNILARLKFDSDTVNDRLSKLCGFFPYGDHCGQALGIDLSDPESGSTTITPDIFEADEKHMSVQFDSRTCIIADEDNTVIKMAERVEKNGFSLKYSFVPPHVVDGESEFIKTLLEQYSLVTGKEGRCLAVGGGTYVHHIENGVAFGAVGEETDTHMHGADEFMLISELKEAAVIYALSIAKLCR